VSFNEVGKAIGDAAKLQMSVNHNNTVFDVKRLIGKKFSDQQVQEDMKLWPFKVIKDARDRAIIQVEEGEEKKTYQPEQISSMILA
jgi:heat shock 70kDa protein 1/2/6/8